jgi:hypothetical protein
MANPSIASMATLARYWRGARALSSSRRATMRLNLSTSMKLPEPERAKVYPAILTVGEY